MASNSDVRLIGRVQASTAPPLQPGRIGIYDMRDRLWVTISAPCSNQSYLSVKWLLVLPPPIPNRSSSKSAAIYSPYTNDVECGRAEKATPVGVEFRWTGRRAPRKVHKTLKRKAEALVASYGNKKVWARDNG